MGNMYYMYIEVTELRTLYADKVMRGQNVRSIFNIIYYNI